jgi:general secretion pathway protein K
MKVPLPDMGKNDGIALILALLVLGLVTAAVISTATLTSKDAELSIKFEEKTKSRYLADAGIKAAIIALREDRNMNEYDTLDEIWSRPSPPITFGEGEAEVQVVDEERKINVNSLILPNGISENTKMVAIFDALLERLELDSALTGAILDWLDEDDAARIGGAESAYYQSRKPSFAAKNDLFDSIYELKLIRGIDEKTFRALYPYVTVHGSGKININTAPENILICLARGEDPDFQSLIDQTAVEEIIEYRSEDPFEKTEDLSKVSSSLEELYRQSRIRDVITTSSTIFTVYATSSIDKSRVRMESKLSRVGKKVVEIYRVAN